jgi:hypothetical protein
MMKTNGKKLQLAKETLRALNGTELGQVAGGSGNQVFTGGGYGAGGGSYELSLRAAICTNGGTGIEGSFSQTAPGACGGQSVLTLSPSIVFGGGH